MGTWRSRLVVLSLLGWVVFLQTEIQRQVALQSILGLENKALGLELRKRSNELREEKQKCSALDAWKGDTFVTTTYEAIATHRGSHWPTSEVNACFEKSPMKIRVAVPCLLCGHNHTILTGKPRSAGGYDVDTRESLTCLLCDLNRRQQAALHSLQNKVLRILKTKDSAGTVVSVYLHEYHTVAFSAAERYLKAPFWGVKGTVALTGSEYLGNIPSGTIQGDIIHQDITNLSFDDESFDVVFSLEVLEHVPSFRAALLEAFRVLKPGGEFVFSTPLGSQYQTQQRIRAESNGTLTYLMPPEDHGNPTLGRSRAGGSLAWWTFGWDLLDHAEDVGFQDCQVRVHTAAETSRGWSLHVECVRPK